MPQKNEADAFALDVSPTVQRQFNRIKEQGEFKSDQDLMQAALSALDDVLDNQHLQPPHPLHTPDSTEPYMKFAGLGIDDYDI